MRDKKKIGIYSLILSSVLSIQFPSLAYAGWQESVDGKWAHINGESVRDTNWKFIDESWYYFDHQGIMATGWQFVNEFWYFLNPVSEAVMGKMLTGWQWIDGKCYYLNPVKTEGYPQGAMYASGQTPDGFLVDSSGAWTDFEGSVQYIGGKGIQTKNDTSGGGSIKLKGGGGSSERGNKGNSKDGSGGNYEGGSSVSNGSGSGETSGSGGEEAASSEGDEDKYFQKPQPQEPATSETSDKDQQQTENVIENFTYTVKYLDIEKQSVLKAILDTAPAKSSIFLDFLQLEGYVICQGQTNEIVLDENDMEVCIYYKAVSSSTPSDAQKVSWEVRFVEEGNHRNEIFKTQKGKTDEGKELVIDFPEVLLGKDRYYYRSLVSSPWKTTVNGAGNQKYYIEFKKGERIEDEADKDEEARGRLRKWIETARNADYELNGNEPSDYQLISYTPEMGKARLVQLVSSVHDAKPHQIYLIAKGDMPSSLIISQTFKDVKHVSELVMDQFSIENETYTVIRVGFTRTFNPEFCIHDYLITDKIQPLCLKPGHETVLCLKCATEETVLLPAAGHKDENNDGVCNICYGNSSQVPEKVIYKLGDVQAHRIGEKIYLFRCIDDDYGDGRNNSQRVALFLCDSLIRSDIESTPENIKKLCFGTDNNYKYSFVRKWLEDHAGEDQFIHSSYIGITRAYEGATEKGAYDQFHQNSLTGYDQQFQLMEDKLFCLSVEEAVKYREYLWRFSGSKENNPRSQLSAYSKGYYLRSPQKGKGIYMVDLTDGSIHPAEVGDTSIGIRPAMTILQGG